MSKRKARPEPKTQVRTEWKLPKGSLLILGDEVQVCDSQDNEVCVLTQDELEEWLTAMSDAFNALSGY